MIEPSGQPISLPPNRQSKVPGMGSDQHAAVNNAKPGAPADQAQYDPGVGKVGTGGMYDNRVPNTPRLDSCAMAAQEPDSISGRFGPAIAESAVGYDAHHSRKQTDTGAMSAAEGSTPIDVIGSDAASTDSRSVDGASTPQGVPIVPGKRGDIGVQQGGMLHGFPRGIIE